MQLLAKLMGRRKRLGHRNMLCLAHQCNTLVCMLGRQPGLVVCRGLASAAACLERREGPLAPSTGRARGVGPDRGELPRAGGAHHDSVLARAVPALPSLRRLRDAAVLLQIIATGGESMHQ